MRQAIAAAAARGSRIVLSGGEPTLNSRLPGYLRLARSLSPPLRAAPDQRRAPGRPRALPLAGRGRAHPRLRVAPRRRRGHLRRHHRGPGTFARTLLGIDQLHLAAVDIQLNFVICGANVDQLTDTIRMVAARWPRASFCVSVVGPLVQSGPRRRGHPALATRGLPPC